MSKIQARAVKIDGTIGINKSLDQAVIDGDVAGGGASPLLSFMGVNNPIYRKEFIGNTWKSITYSPDLKRLISVADSGTSDRVMYSADLGQTWFGVGATFTQAWKSVAYGDIFVAVASSGEYMTSDNGYFGWSTPASLAGGGNWLSIAYGNNTFVAVAGTDANSSARVATSPDGSTWTRRSHSLNTNWINVEFCNDRFIAGGDSGIATSLDGITWTYTYTGTGSYAGFAYGKGVYVAVGNSDTLKYSYDAVTWYDVSLASFRDGRNYVTCAFGNGLFYAISPSGNGFNAIASKDGITWRQVSTLPGTWNDVIYVNNCFLAVGSTNTNNRIMQTMRL